jgi:hypothetical protein
VVIVTGCASVMAEQAEQGQSTATDFFASVHINSKEVMVVGMYELRNPMKLAGASPAVQRAELSHSQVILSDLFYGNNPGSLRSGGLRLIGFGSDLQGLRRMVLNFLVQNTGPGKRIVGGGAYIIVRDSLVNKDYSADIHRFTAEQRRGTARNP